MLTLIPSVTKSVKGQLLLFPQKSERVLVMADMVCSALVEEAGSRGVSFLLGKRAEVLSQGHIMEMERLEVAVSHGKKNLLI